MIQVMIQVMSHSNQKSIILAVLWGLPDIALVDEASNKTARLREAGMRCVEGSIR